MVILSFSGENDVGIFHGHLGFGEENDVGIFYGHFEFV